MIPFYNPIPETTFQDNSIVSSKDRENITDNQTRENMEMIL